jgi:three-Cys-motif partner protein
LQEVTPETKPGRLLSVTSTRRFDARVSRQTRFLDKREDILVRSVDANAYLQEICLKSIWKGHRAVLFIDPFGMQLSWDTLKAVASTEAIDTWILFPVSAVNRLLVRNAEIPDSVVPKTV